LKSASEIAIIVHTDRQPPPTKRQTRRETGAQSHGSANETNADRQTAEDFGSAVLFAFILRQAKLEIQFRKGGAFLRITEN